MTHPPQRPQRTISIRKGVFGVAVTGGILFSAFLLASPQMQRVPGPGQGLDNPLTNPMSASKIPTNQKREKTEKQKEALVKYHYIQMKKHVDHLAELAQSLQEKINKTNRNVLSLEVIRKAEEIEKLAKKIKNEAKGY